MRDYGTFLRDELVKIPNLKVDPLEYVLRECKINPGGLWLEFGVYQGNTINKISESNQSQVIYGFDSFEGFPVDGETDSSKPPNNGRWYQGKYSTQGVLPDVNSNVRLVSGWFSDTLPNFCLEHREFVSFLHVDSDLYSSAKCIFEHLGDRMVDGTIIVFDELVNYPGYQNGEIKVFYEFLQSHPEFSYKWIGMNGSAERDRLWGSKKNQSVAVRLLKIR